MTILAELAGTVTVTDDGSAALLGAVEITDAGPFWFTLDVDARAAVAMAQRFQQLGAGITINMVAIPDCEIGDALTITESADSYGDRLTFQLIGHRFSPFARDLLRSKAAVDVSLVIGNTANEFRKKVFSGYVVAHSFDAQGPAATVECMDAAALYAEKRAKTWTLAPNSGRSRLSIGLELAAVGGIPIGHVDLGGNGGTVTKPLAPGNQPILDYLRDIWGILGAEIGFEDGKLTARRYDPDAPAVLEINASNLLLPVSIASPDTLAPNVLGVVSVAFSQEEIGGLRTEETRVITTGPYAPVSASGTWATADRVISEIVTRTTYLGTLDVRAEREEWGWYAVRAAGAKMQTTGTAPFYELVTHTDFQTWVFPDGSTRGDSVEKFRRISRHVVTKEVDADYNVVAIREEKYGFRFLRAAVWEVTAGVDELAESPRYINDEGQGVQGGIEMMGLVNLNGVGMEGGLPQSSTYIRPVELTETEITLNADGTIFSEVETHHYYSIGAPVLRADGAYGYGIDSVEYTARPQEAMTTVADQWGGLRVTTRRFRVINEDRYEVTERVTISGQPPRTTTSTVNGAPPRPERAEPESSSQDITAVVEDRERIFLAGEEIEDVEHNEFIETYGEAQAYAKIRARRASARVLTCEIPIESLAHKFRMVRVNLPGSSIDGLKFYVREVSRNAATFREGIIAEYYSPQFD